MMLTPPMLSLSDSHFFFRYQSSFSREICRRKRFALSSMAEQSALEGRKNIPRIDSDSESKSTLTLTHGGNRNANAKRSEWISRDNNQQDNPINDDCAMGKIAICQPINIDSHRQRRFVMFFATDLLVSRDIAVTF